MVKSLQLTLLMVAMVIVLATRSLTRIGIVLTNLAVLNLLVLGTLHDKTGCPAIDFETGKRKAGSIKKDLYTCDTVPTIDSCLLEEMTEIALNLRKRIRRLHACRYVCGRQHYIRTGKHLANHMNGLRSLRRQGRQKWMYR
jgi:hypothetical protein